MAGLDDSRYVHAEYAAADGRIVTADGIMRRGIVMAVQVGGDTFPQPDDALAAVEAVLRNAPADSDEALLAEATRQALQSGAAGVVWHAIRE